MRKVILIITLTILMLLTCAHVGTASEDSPINYTAYRESWDTIVKSDESQRNCVDAAVLYARENPDWFFITMSPNPEFRHQPHMANYKIEGNKLIIHDELFNFDYEDTISENMVIPYYMLLPEKFDKAWEGETYIHFETNEDEITRTYISLSDNRDEFFDYNATSITEVVPVNAAVEENNTIVNTTVFSSNETTVSTGIGDVVIALIKSILPN
jgi:hypothetical protein